MAIQIEKTFQVEEPIDQVWALLSDPRRVAVCVPGAKITEQVNETTYKGAITVKVGPSTTDYKGEVQVVRVDAATHEIEIVGKGQDVKGRGSASMKMTGKARVIESGGTEITSTSELNVVGVLAQMGTRVIHEVSNVIFSQFVKNFQAQLRNPGETGAAEAKPMSAAALAWAVAKSKLHRDS